MNTRRQKIGPKSEKGAIVYSDINKAANACVLTFTKPHPAS
jgi:hypothetical protein